MLSERRADELKRMSKGELITLLLEAEQVRDRVQRALASLQDREPGRYAFWHRHLALAYVRKVNPELHQEAASAACAQIDEQGGKSYQDVVTGLEAACEAAIAELVENEYQTSTQRVLAQLRAALEGKSNA